MVCDAVDPAMTFASPLAAAIAEHRGEMLIHGAIIAREYGIPCVTGIPEATRRICTGDRLTVDGCLDTDTGCRGWCASGRRSVMYVQATIAPNGIPRTFVSCAPGVRAAAVFYRKQYLTPIPPMARNDVPGNRYSPGTISSDISRGTSRKR